MIKAEDKSIAFYAVSEQMFNAPSADSPGANIYQEAQTLEDIRQLKAENDCVVVLYHGGQEFYKYPSPAIRKRCHVLADAGADAVLVQHSHQLISREEYNNTEILYGQGNTQFCILQQKIDEGVLFIINVQDGAISFDYQYIQRQDIKACCSEMPDSFLERSAKTQEGAEFKEEFSQFSEKKLLLFLKFYRGKNIFDSILEKVLPPDRYKKYLLGRYTEYQLLRILNTYRCDEHREILTTALEDVLDI